MHLVSRGPDDTAAIAARIAGDLLARMADRTTALIVALEGELGAGKTTLVQGIARALAVRETPKSPTFTLAKEYAVPGTSYRLVHMDCYRLTGHTDLAALDGNRIWADPFALVLVEWAQRIMGALPRDHIVIRMAHAGGDKRSITVDTEPK
jgi:tRNA threonylcarbamoyladenosine biosynthesis protein TsaE